VISNTRNLHLTDRMMSIRTTIYALLAVFLSIPAAHAQMPANIAVAEVLEGWRDADGRHYAALSIRLAPGWKTYWRTPGTAGIPPVFDWAASDNVEDVTVAFPVPNVFEQNGMTSIGYADQVVFPLIVRPSDSTEDIALRGQLLIGVCEDICVPLELELTATLQADGSQHTATIARAMKDRPMTAQEAGIRNIACEIVPIDDGLRITARIGLPRMGRNEVAVIELADRGVWVSEPLVRRDGATLVAQSDMVPPNAQPFLLSRNDVRITVIGDGRAVDIQGCS
jgi:DsbC/DsbD-like thiol-disulfide interchange protein